jgi:hypothetical protein
MEGEDTLILDQGADTGGDAGDVDVNLEVGDQGADTGDQSADKSDQVDTGDKGDQGADDAKDQRQQQTKEEPEIEEFKGLVSARMRSIIKQAPELAQVFKKYPELQNRVEAAFRKAVAYSDVFPTVAEARTMREHFPNGQADVQELLNDVKEIEELDNNFDKRDTEGNYPGHAAVINSFFERNREAAVSMFKQMPKEWHRLHPESYNEVMGKVVGATFAARQIPEFLTDLQAMAKEAEQPDLEKGISKLLNWVNGYLAEKPRPTQEEERLANERKSFERTKSESNQVEQKRFHSSFVAEARKTQLGIINEHPAIKRVLANTAITKEKKDAIVEQVRSSIEKFLGRSPSFMRKLRPAYEKRDLNETVTLQKAAWAQPWLLNRMIRSVLTKEVPQMVSQNRDAAARRTGTQQPRVVPGKTGDRARATPKGPQKINGRWYRENGQPFSTSEVLAGKHLAT